MNAVLFEAECDAAFREIIWRQLTRNLVARKNFDKVFSNFPRNVSQNNLKSP